jgi:hypothetical protein
MFKNSRDVLELVALVLFSLVYTLLRTGPTDFHSESTE